MTTSKRFEFLIQWHLTEQCNLWCRHCYQGDRSSDEMPLSRIKKTAAEASDIITEWADRCGISIHPSTNITGGEPFLRGDLFTILQEIKSHGFETHLLTNGTLVDEAGARRLADIGIDGVQVSIDGPEYVHDGFRGDGAFAASAAGIESLIRCGIEVSLNVTLSRLNAEQAGGVIAFASRTGVRRVGITRLVPAGRGRKLLKHMLSGNELKAAYGSLLSARTEGVPIVTNDPVAAQMDTPSVRDAGSIAVSGCAAGVSGLTILPDGTILPCRRLPLVLGNVNRDSLREVWAGSPVLEAFRDRTRYAGKCGSCRRWAICRGCRAIVYEYSRAAGGKDFLGDDPQCFIENDA